MTGSSAVCMLNHSLWKAFVALRIHCLPGYRVPPQWPWPLGRASQALHAPRPLAPVSAASSTHLSWAVLPTVLYQEMVAVVTQLWGPHPLALPIVKVVASLPCIDSCQTLTMAPLMGPTGLTWASWGHSHGPSPPLPSTTVAPALWPRQWGHLCFPAPALSSTYPGDSQFCPGSQRMGSQGARSPAPHEVAGYLAQPWR